MFSPIELIKKLADLVPPPRVNQVLYHGVMAPRAKWRKQIVPQPPARDLFKPLDVRSIVLAAIGCGLICCGIVLGLTTEEHSPR